jgi:hypothetical protein
MKIKYFFGLMILLPVAMGPFISCTKDKAASASLIDSIVYHNYSPPLQICTCGGNKYLLDLDFDGVPDVELSMSCLDTNIVPWSGCFYFTTSINVNVDTIFNTSIRLSQYYNLYNQYILYGCNLKDSINSSYHATTSISAMSYYREIVPCPPADTFFYNFNIPSSGSEYFGFAKTVTNGTKYGWFAMHFDSSYNLYLDGVAINNAINKPILAGEH